MTLPDQLTLARALAVPIVIVLFAWDFEDHLYWATAVFAVAMATDQVDGWLARRRNQTSAFGSLLDPIADKVLVLAALVMLVAEGVAPAWMVAAIVAREIAVSGLRLAAIERGVVMGARDLGKLKTWAQTVAATLAGLQAAGAWDDRRGVVGAAGRDAADVDLGARLRARGAARAARRERGLVGRRGAATLHGARSSASARPARNQGDVFDIGSGREVDRAADGRPPGSPSASGSSSTTTPAPGYASGQQARGRRLERRDDELALAQAEPLDRPCSHLGGQRPDASRTRFPSSTSETIGARTWFTAVSAGISRAIETSQG